MKPHDEKLIDILQYLYRLCHVRDESIRDVISMNANKALDAEFWSEAFRYILYDTNTSRDDLKTILSSHLTELGHKFNKSDSHPEAYFEISYFLQQFQNDEFDVLKAAQYVLLNLEYEDLVNDQEFPHLYDFTAVYYQWWAGDSEWMLGEQLEEARQNAISNLKTEARCWLDKHGVANPFDGL